jgi:hypothetical protein
MDAAALQDSVHYSQQCWRYPLRSSAPRVVPIWKPIFIHLRRRYFGETPTFPHLHITLNLEMHARSPQVGYLNCKATSTSPPKTRLPECGAVVSALELIKRKSPKDS